MLLGEEMSQFEGRLGIPGIVGVGSSQHVSLCVAWFIFQVHDLVITFVNNWHRQVHVLLVVAVLGLSERISNLRGVANPKEDSISLSSLLSFDLDH
jgi:hypothetical protein